MAVALAGGLLLWPSATWAEPAELAPADVVACTRVLAQKAWPLGGEVVANEGLSASAEAGRAPLEVDFSILGDGRSYFGGVWLDFGDGGKVMVCRPGSGCDGTTVTHAYIQPGTYSAELIAEGEGAQTILGAVRVVVGE